MEYHGEPAQTSRIQNLHLVFSLADNKRLALRRNRVASQRNLRRLELGFLEGAVRGLALSIIHGIYARQRSFHSVPTCINADEKLTLGGFKGRPVLGI